MSNPQSITGGPADGGTSIKFRFNKSDGYREIVADGLWFSVGPQKQIHFTSYTDKFHLPELVQVDVDHQGRVITQHILKQDTEWILREFGVDIIMSLDAAKNFHAILGNNLKTLESQL